MLLKFINKNMKNMVVLVPYLAWNLDLPRLRMSRKKCPVLSHFCPVLRHFFERDIFGAEKRDKTGRCPPPPIPMSIPHTLRLAYSARDFYNIMFLFLFLLDKLAYILTDSKSSKMQFPADNTRVVTMFSNVRVLILGPLSFGLRSFTSL